MKNATQCAKAFAALFQKLPEGEAPEFADARDPISVLLLSFLMYDSTTEKALAAYGRLTDHVVDFNDLRVCMPHEVVGYIGSRYPKGLERCQRLRATLRNIYLREHKVSLDELTGEGERDIKKYIESLEGIVPYVAARVMLLCFDTHAMPVDARTGAALVAAGAADEEADAGQISVWLSRQIKAGEGVEAHFRLQTWVDSQEARVGRKKAPVSKRSKNSPAKKTSRAGKKTTASSRRKASN